mmetsp:Transcript_50153/g.115753  ORF Transcript_50153/g.115753 Transcript_50153/m.115753 type:complete len:647 (-) Transcript_50153:773-2713(-)
MNAAAQVTSDDGDKVNHGWSQLDIGKHSTNTFIASLGAEDFVTLISYSDAAKVVLDWTRCDEVGIASALAAVNSLRPDRRTNLMSALTTGFSQITKFPMPESELYKYTIGMIVTTDGMPSAEFNPARGRDGYAVLVKNLRKQLVAKRGLTAYPNITAIGLGYSLDSGLLQDMSDQFLHMPDPGTVGPFMVNLLAALRCTARLPHEHAAAANMASLLVSPADAVKPNGVPGYSGLTSTFTSDAGIPTMRIQLGSVLYDQTRNVVLELNASSSNFSVSFDVTGMPPCGTMDHTEAKDANANAAMSAKIEANILRLRAVDALKTTVQSTGNTAAIDSVLALIASSSVLSAEAAEVQTLKEQVQALKHTLETEALQGCDPEKYRRWGSHYLRTLTAMLRLERRSNFRDQALQHFGRDVEGREALFEEESNKAEMNFATLPAPEPSLLSTGAIGVPMATNPMASEVGMYESNLGAPPPPAALPAEFMRGGGCFAPEAQVLRVCADGSATRSRIDAVRVGDLLKTASGGLARVRCVLVTECDGGRVMLTRLPSGLELTEWHPVLDSAGRWRFPIMLGTRIIRKCPCVYNLFMEGGKVLDVGGVPCVTLAHGLTAEVVAHPYWGTDAVLRDMQAAPGWEEGRVVFRGQHMALA